MGDSRIEWTGKTWQVTAGCTEKSPGCKNCYARRMAGRLAAMATADIRAGRNPGKKRVYLQVVNQIPEEGLNGYGPNSGWNRKLLPLEDRLAEPLGWKKGTRIFVNSESDLFHEDVPFDFVDRVFAVMALCPQHTFQVLTKRPERMAEYLNDYRSMLGMKSDESVWKLAACMDGERFTKAYRPNLDDIGHWPLPNVWLACSVENQKYADERRESMKRISEAGWTTFVSYEPALGPVSWKGWEFINWIISGGESGSRARPSHPRWHRATRDYCVANGIAYFFKQWGCWLGSDEKGRKGFTYGGDVDIDMLDDDEPRIHDWGDGYYSIRTNKKAAGRLLDGRTWDEFPKVEAMKA